MADPRPLDCLTEGAMAAYLDGAVDDDQRRSAEEHLVRCSTCRSAIADAARGALGDTDAQATLAEATLLAPNENSDAWLPGAGDVIADKYLVEGYLGSGSMGWVVAACHRDLGQRVAIKVLRPTGTEAARRFLAEAKITARLSHPNIPRVFDVGRLPSGAPYMIMEYLVGTDLARLAAADTISIEAAVRYVVEACAGLSAAHAAGVVHRDLKPSNLFLATGPDGETTVKVLDFGISKVIDSRQRETNQAATATGIALGSPLYMSPEQIRARPDIDTRSDVWSLGVILYQLTTGHPPFRGPGVPALSVSIAVDEPAPPSRHCPGMSPALERIILRCLAKSPSARYATVEELARDLFLLGRSAGSQRRPRSALRTAGGVVITVFVGLGVAAAGRAWTRKGNPTPASVAPAIVPAVSVSAQVRNAATRSTTESVPIVPVPPERPVVRHAKRRLVRGAVLPGPLDTPD